VRELIRWTQTVTKHEALAIRQGRERLLGRQHPADEDRPEPVAQLPATGDGPDEQVERREAVARSREALQTLKPAERQALALLAEGYSYAEIGALTGFSATKVNRVLSEGRARFRSVISGSEDGSRCRELQPLLSAFCDGEADERDAAVVREHLRACARCRSTARAYRSAPRIVAGLAPLLPPTRSLLGRAHDLVSDLWSRLPGIGGGKAAATAPIAAAGGSGGAGIGALAKLLVVCAGTAGGVGACVATGVLPAPQPLTPDRVLTPALEHAAPAAVEPPAEGGGRREPAPTRAVEPKAPPAPDAEVDAPEPEPVEPEPAAAEIEYEAPPPPPPTATGTTAAAAPSTSGSAAGEFGP
jgi:RNA polymerase sigma factor (sigma-70 family)